MRLAGAALYFLLATSIPGVLGASSPPSKKIASGSGIHGTDRLSIIPSLSSGQSSSSTPQSGIIDTLLSEHGASSCKEFVENVFSKSEEKSGDNYIPPPNDVTIPIPIRGKDEALDKFKSMLPVTKKFLNRNGRGPRDNNEMEKDNWDTLSVLGYSLVERLYPLVKSKCDTNGKFQCRTIDQLKVGEDLRGTYRLYDSENNIVKTGLSNEVMGGIIKRTFEQLVGKELDDDEEADEEDKKGITVAQAKNILVKNHKEDVAFYFTVDEQMEMVKEDKVIMEIVEAIAMLAPAFAGWDESLSEKRNQEILNFGFEAVCACSFSGSKYHNVMEMFFTLGSTTLREMIKLPSTEMNQLVVELLRSRRLTPEQIKCIFTWQHATNAVRRKGVELRADTDNSSNIKTGDGVSDMIRDFHSDDPASFLQLLENQIIFGSKSISYEDAYPSQSYAQAVAAADGIVNVLESDRNNKQDEIITHVQTLCGLDRYDDPQGSNAYVNAVNDALVKAEREVNSGLLVIEDTMKDVSKFDTIFPAYKKTLRIKNDDGSVAGTIYTDNNDSPLILTLPSLHLMRGAKVTDKQRFVTRQAQLSIMKCLCDAGIVRDTTALETQQKAAYSQLLWTEGMGNNDAKEVMSNESDINKCDGSSEKGRMVVLGSLCRRNVKEGVDFIGKLMSGKYVFDADSNPSLGKNVTNVSIDNVIVACLVAELRLANFARMMDIGYGINSDVAGVDFLKEGTSFSNNWLCLKHRIECGNKVQQRWEGADEENGSDDELPPHNFD